MYDGYHFCENTEGIYNPFSILNTFDSLRFKEYWFETGTPTFLVKVMKETDYDISSLSDQEVDASSLMDIDTAYHNPIPLLYQAGYLTIRGYDEELKIYHLGFPNREVKHGFLNFLSRYYTPSRSESVESALQQIEEKGYARRFADDPRELFKIGVRFSTETRCIHSWKIV